MFATIFTTMKTLKDTFIHRVVDTSRGDEEDDNFDLDFKPLYSQELSNNSLDFSSHDSGMNEPNDIHLVLPSESQKENNTMNENTDEEMPSLIPAVVEVHLPSVSVEESVPTVVNTINTIERISDISDEIFNNIDLDAPSLQPESNVNDMNQEDNACDRLEEFFRDVKTTDLTSPIREHMVESMNKLDPDTENKSKFKLYSTIMRRKLRPNIKVSDESVCDICNFKFENHVQTLLPCNHGFHNKCINMWLKYSQYCPICKLELTNEIPTKEYIDEKYPHDYLIQIMTELALLESGVDYNNKDVLIYRYIEYLNTLSEKKSISRKSSSDSLELAILE